MREFTDPDHIDVQRGEPFAVVLSDNAAGAYRWFVADCPAAVRLRREDERAPGEGAPGATGVKVFELEALEPGAFTLRFERRPEHEPEAADRERAVVVEAR